MRYESNFALQYGPVLQSRPPYTRKLQRNGLSKKANSDLLFLSLRLCFLPNWSLLGVGMGLLSWIIKIMYSCFLLLDAFRALKQVKARRRAATTTLTSADRLRRRNIKNSLSQTLVWVLYIALESTTRKAAFLVPFYDYWNLLVLWIVTQKSQYVLNRVVKLITPYEFIIDFIGVVLVTIIDFVALLPSYFSRRWRGTVDSKSLQTAEPILTNLPPTRAAPPPPKRRSPPKSSHIASPQVARHVPTNLFRTASLASFRNQLEASQREPKATAAAPGMTAVMRMERPAEVMRVNPPVGKSTTSNPVQSISISTATASSSIKGSQRSQPRQLKAAKAVAVVEDEGLSDTEMMDLDDLRVDEALSTPLPPTPLKSTPPFHPPEPTAVSTPSQIETPPTQKQPRTAFNQFSSALDNVTSLAALATPAPPLPGGFTFKFSTPDLYPRFDAPSNSLLPISPVRQHPQIDIESAANAVPLPANLPSPARSAEPLPPAPASPRQKAYAAINSLASNAEEYSISSLHFAKKSTSSKLASSTTASQGRVGIVGGMRGKKRTTEAVEEEGGKGRKVAREGGMKDVRSLGSVNTAPGSSGGVLRASVSRRTVEMGAGKGLGRSTSGTTNPKPITAPAKRPRPGSSLSTTLPASDSDDEASTRPITKASRIAKSTSTINLSRSTRTAPSTTLIPRTSPRVSVDALPPRTASQTTAIPKSRPPILAPSFRSAVAPSTTKMKRQPVVAVEEEVVPATKRATRATRSSARK